MNKNVWIKPCFLLKTNEYVTDYICMPGIYYYTHVKRLFIFFFLNFF